MKINGAVHLLEKIKLLFERNFFRAYVRLCACFGFRPRYFFTRQNKLRLRYLAYIWLFIFALSSFDSNRFDTAQGAPALSNDIVIAQLNPSLSPPASKETGSKDVSPARSDDRYVSKTLYIEDGSQAVTNHSGNIKVKDANIIDNEPAGELEFAGLSSSIENLKITRLEPGPALDDIKLNGYVANPQESSDKRSVTTLHTEDGKENENLQIKLASAASKTPVVSQAPAPSGHQEHTAEEQTESFKEGLVKRVAYPVPPKPRFQDNGRESIKTKSVQVKSGDTFAQILYKAGAKGPETQKIINAVTSEYDPRYLRVGQTIHFEYKTNRLGAKELTKLSMPLDKVRTLSVRKAGFNTFDSGIEKLRLEPRLRAKNITIQSSLYGSAMKQGLPRDVVDKVLAIYAWDVDFQRDLHKGDRLEILYEELVGRDGEVVDYGDLKYASLSVKGTSIPVYQYKMKDGRTDYFEPNGHSIRKTLMMTPIDGARISSGYGMRRHPILGYSKMHKGVDFAAPIGTPIYAAGDGVVERIGRYGAYGKYIRIRHNNRLKTAYAHLNGYKKGLRKGSRVKQGDVIGYLGNTGRSTGPHLHYEILVNDRQVKPGSLDLPTGKILTGHELNEFRSQIEKHHENYALHLDDAKYAMISKSR